MLNPCVAALTVLFGTLSTVDGDALSSTVAQPDALIDLLGELQLLASEREAEPERFADSAQRINDTLLPIKLDAQSQQIDHHLTGAFQRRRRRRAKVEPPPPPPQGLTPWDRRAMFCTHLDLALCYAVGACRAETDRQAQEEIAKCASRIGEALYTASQAA